MDSYYKLRQLFLLQSKIRFITNCHRHYKVRWIYYKLPQVYITKCDDYYKLRQNDCKSWVWVWVWVDAVGKKMSSKKIKN